MSKCCQSTLDEHGLMFFSATKGKILTLGGSPSYDGSAATSNAHIITLGEPNQGVQVEKIANGAYPRAFANAVVLPDGKVIILGGTTYARLFSDLDPVLFPEMFDPATKTFTKVYEPSPNYQICRPDADKLQLRSHIIPRNYHSTALLLPDATVFHGGGGLCNGCSANHFDGQIFSPPYLFQADGVTPASRPSIFSATDKVKPGGMIMIQMADAGSYSFSLIRMGSATHAVNTDQRRIPLETTGSGAGYETNLPSDTGVLLPGYWMLFAIDANGVPSVAKTVHVSPDN